MAWREDLAAAKQDMTETALGIDAVHGDVDRLHAKITEMDNSPDKLGETDKALFAEIVALANTLKTNVKALDDKTPLPATDTGPGDPV